MIKGIAIRGTMSLHRLRASEVGKRLAIYFRCASNDYAKLQENVVQQYFSKFGSVEDLRIAKDVGTHKQCNWGLVLFKSGELLCEETAIKRVLQGPSQVDIGGIPIAIQPGQIRLRPDLESAAVQFTGFLRQSPRCSSSGT